MYLQVQITVYFYDFRSVQYQIKLSIYYKLICSNINCNHNKLLWTKKLLQ